MVAIQESELSGAEKSSESWGVVFHGGETGEALNRVEAHAFVVEALQRNTNILSGIDSIETTEEVQLEDVIEADRGDFFVAVAADEFTAVGKYCRGTSTKRFLFRTFKGKKNGDVITLNDNKFTLMSSY
ncbi:MAG: hypothetical protein OTI34_04085 [Lewinella sp.]|jgi:hypothetical protein|nr:hypothetical protein [Lewinella sp.]